MKKQLSETQFDLAINQLRMSEDNIKAARLYFVEGEDPKNLHTQYGISPSRLSKILKRVAQNYDKQLAMMNLVSAEYTLDPETAKLVRKLELTKVNEAKVRLHNQRKLQYQR